MVLERPVVTGHRGHMTFPETNGTLRSVVLWVAGLIAVAIGAAIFLAPGAVYAGNGIELGSDPSLLSETRAPAGALFACGLVIVAGAQSPRFTFTSLWLATVLYLAYGSSRVVSLLVDGAPALGLVVAAVVELAVGVACLACLVREERRGAATEGTVRALGRRHPPPSALRGQ